ncbi:MAG: universal stress protein [archaeon]|nr:universal stress protein [archaeon]
MSILVAYDGREQTQKALAYAIDHAIKYDTDLYIFSAIVSKDQLDHEDEMAKVDGYLKEAEERAKKAGAKAHMVYESGVPWKGILKSAERYDCDTVVVGRASNKSSFDRAFLGSVSDAVVRNAKCIVIIVQ